MDRLDVVLVKLGLFESRSKASKAIEDGKVKGEDGKVYNKASFKVSLDTKFVIEDACPYVSRGGYKLEKALKVFKIDLKDKVMIDIGASTGGFTSCALLNGASKVYAIDVGHDQLHASLRANKRVINLEGLDFKSLDPNIIKDIIDFGSIDVSFTSVRLMFPSLHKILKEDGKSVILIKPQFEAGKEYLNKNGVVKDKKAHIKVINNIIDDVKINEMSVLGLTYSPIKGDRSGNIEYLIYISNSKNKSINVNIEEVVDEAFNELK